MFSQIAQRRAGHFARPDAEDQTTSSSSTSTTSRKTPNTKYVSTNHIHTNDK